MRKVYLIILIVLTLAGCTPSAPKPAATLISSPVPEETHEVTQTQPPSRSIFDLFTGNPVLVQSKKPAWDSYYMDPGAVVYHDGMFHMFYNGIASNVSAASVGYATSTDGNQWTKQTDSPLITSKNLSDGNHLGANFFVCSGLVEDDGTWVLYFYTLNGNSFQGSGDIGRATAPSPTGPWSIDPEPVLSPGPPGAWDEVQVASPSVVKTQEGYKMYFDGLGAENTSTIGLATSKDGIHWTKYNDPATNDPLLAESDPVLTADANSWDSIRVIDPNVVQTNDGWVMIYLSTNGLKKFSPGEYLFGLAVSSDGVKWEKSAQSPILSNKNDPDWHRTFLTTLLYVDNKFFYYFDFESVHGNGTNVYLATFDGQLK